MAKPFKFRHVNQIAGTFVGAILLAFVVAFVMAGRAQKWFVKVQPVLVMLPDKGSLGLKVGGEVRMFGVTVGTVDAIDPPNENGKMLMHAHVDRGYAAFIRIARDGGTLGSQAIIHIPLALGDPFLEFTKGAGESLPLIEPTLPSLTAVPESGTGDAITQLVDDVRTRTLPAVQTILEQYSQLAVELRSQEGPLQHTLAHLDQVTANLQRTDSVVGRLTTDKGMAEQLNQSIVRLSSTIDALHGVMADLQKTSAGLPVITRQGQGVMTQASAAIGNVRDSTAQLPAVMLSLKQSVDTLPGVMAHTQQSLVELEKLVRGMQALPLIRDHIDQTPQTATLRPTALAEEP